jgi:hypothetical protein
MSFTFDPVELDPGAARKVALDLFADCANFWEANQQYGVGDYVRPTLSTGFAYQSSGGTSARREPAWPTVLGETVTDGSIVWTCAAAGANGINAVSALTASSDPSGLTVSDVSVNDSTQIFATYSASAGVVGQSFEAIFDFTLNGVARRVRQLVQIAKQ